MSKAAESVYNMLPAESWLTHRQGHAVSPIRTAKRRRGSSVGVMHTSSEEYPGPSPSKTILYTALGPCVRAV